MCQGETNSMISSEIIRSREVPASHVKNALQHPGLLLARSVPLPLGQCEHRSGHNMCYRILMVTLPVVLLLCEAFLME